MFGTYGQTVWGLDEILDAARGWAGLEHATCHQLRHVPGPAAAGRMLGNGLRNGPDLDCRTQCVRDVRLLPHRHSKSQFVGLPISSTSATIVGAPIAGQNVDTTLTVAVIGDLKHDGIFNDAAVYGLGLIGALVRYWPPAHSPGEPAVSTLEAVVWPAFLVYDALKALHR